jgi:LysR family hca operon transcriptional activator
MELRHLRYFLAVAELGSLTQAAEERLHTSQPSLSRQIRDLEHEIGADLFNRSAQGVELTDSGRAFLDHARLALSQVDAAVEAARRAAEGAIKKFAIGFLTGQEMVWLPEAMHILRDQLANVEVTISSGYPIDLAEDLARGKIDLAFMRAEPEFDLRYRVVTHERLVVLMPSDHRLAARKSIRPRDLIGEPFIAMATPRAKVLRAVIDSYLKQNDVLIAPTQATDNPAAVMSLIVSTRGLTIIPSYVENLMPQTVVSRPLSGDAPTIDLVIGYSESNSSPVLKLFLSRLDQLIGRVSKQPR